MSMSSQAEVACFPQKAGGTRSDFDVAHEHSGQVAGQALNTTPRRLPGFDISHQRCATVVQVDLLTSKHRPARRRCLEEGHIGP